MLSVRFTGIATGVMMLQYSRWCWAWMAIVAIPAVARSEEPLHARIDSLVSAQFDGRRPAGMTEDAAFLRRVWLDLAGRIPSAAEARRFIDDPDPEKRAKLIDRLLAAATYPQRMQDLFHVMLMERRGDNEHWSRFLRTSFEKNKPWDWMVRQILLPDESDEDVRGAAFFYTKRLEHYGQNPIDYPGLTRDIGRLFLGVDLQCAQCHDHLFITNYEQREFQGLYSVYQNLSIRGGVDYPAVDEKPMKQKHTFLSVFNPIERETGPRIPFGEECDVPESAEGEAPLRALAWVAEQLPKTESGLFTDNIVNRLWFIMMGHGLVYPLDLHRAENPPSHPELLQLLATEFAGHQYDIKWLLRELALSETYQRSSRVPEGEELPALESYLVASEKRLSPEQLLASMLEATGPWEHLTQASADGNGDEKLDQLRDRFIAAFANEPKEPEERINPTVKAALFLLNDDEVLALLQRQPGNLIDRLACMDEPQALTDELFLSVFSRRPTDGERADALDFLSAHSERRETALAHVVWAMLTSTEFCVNH